MQHFTENSFLQIFMTLGIGTTSARYFVMSISKRYRFDASFQYQENLLEIHSIFQQCLNQQKDQHNRAFFGLLSSIKAVSTVFFLGRVIPKT